MAPTRTFATLPTSPESQRIDLDFTSEDSATQSHDTLRKLPLSTTSISIKGYGSLLNISTLDEALEHLLLPLEELHFDMTIPMPTSTLSAIETFHTHTRLYYHMSFSHWDPFDSNVPSIQILGVEPSHSYRNQLRRGIIGSKNLYALKASILYGGRDNHEDLPLVHEILKSCPNIRELDLSIDHSGCVVANYPYAFDFTGGATQLPPLEKLKLSRYRLDHYKNGDQVSSLDLTPLPWLNRIIKNLNPWVDWSYWIATRPSEPFNLDGWIEHMDWSKLKYLELDSVDKAILERLESVATGLECLSIHHADNEASLYFPDFLSNMFKPLRHLTLRNLQFDDYTGLITAIGTDHPTLQSLTLTETEDNRRWFCSRRSPDEVHHDSDEIYCPARPYLDEHLLSSLAERNKNMSHLTIDVPRIIPNLTDTSTWTLDYATVKAAALQPSLTHLSLHVESPEHVLVRNNRKPTYMYKLMGEGVELPSFFDDPSFNRTSVPKLLECMSQWRREAFLSPLKQLEIRVSRFDLKDNDDWGMMPPPNILFGRWVCRDDGSGMKCFGGNDRLGFYSSEEPCEIQEPYSENWSLPDQRTCGPELILDWKHDEL